MAGFSLRGMRPSWCQECSTRFHRRCPALSSEDKRNPIPGKECAQTAIRETPYFSCSFVLTGWLPTKMPFETRIRELSEQLGNCRDDVTALKLAQELQAVLHERIEQLRGAVRGLSLLTRQGQEHGADEAVKNDPSVTASRNSRSMV